MTLRERHNSRLARRVDGALDEFGDLLYEVVDGALGVDSNLGFSPRRPNEDPGGVLEREPDAVLRRDVGVGEGVGE